MGQLNLLYRNPRGRVALRGMGLTFFQKGLIMCKGEGWPIPGQLKRVRISIDGEDATESIMGILYDNFILVNKVEFGARRIAELDKRVGELLGLAGQRTADAVQADQVRI